MRTTAVVSAVLLACAAASAEESATPPPRDPVAALLAARTADERKAAIDAVVASNPDPETVAAALAAGRTYAADVPKGWVERTIVAPDGKERPYLLFVPPKYDPARRHRMVVDLHGGVSRPRTLTHDELSRMAYAWGAAAAEDAWILAIPAGETGAVWWDPVGSGTVLSILRETKRTYHVDEDRVFATGFSDGASGSWFLAAAHPTPFAGFVPLSGHVGVAGAGGTQIHLRSLLNKPVYATNTDLDSLYPSAGLRPVMEALQALGAPLVWRDIAGFRHDPTYLESERPAILRWMSGVRRDPDPKVVWWEGADGAPSRVHWLRVTRVAGGSGREPFPDVNPALTETRVRIGFAADQGFAGPGVRVDSVQEGSLGASMGLARGDVITALDGTEVEDFAGLRTLLGRKRFGDELTVRWTRGAETTEKSARIPAARSEPAFDRTKPWGTIRAEAKGQRIEVTCLGIAAFDLLLSPRLVDLAKPFEVTVNGKPVHSGTVAADLRFLLGQWAEDEDRSLVYRAKLSLAGDAVR